MKRTPPKPVKLSPEQIVDIEGSVFALVEQHLDPNFYLLAVDFEKEAGYWYLRIYVEGKNAPVSLNDCEQISRHLDPLIDTIKALDDMPYSLEISSPGLFRPLKKAREFDFYAGKPVRVEIKTTKTAPGKQPPAREGILQGFDAERRVLTLQSSSQEAPLEVPLDEQTVVYLNPEVHFPEEDEV